MVRLREPARVIVVDDDRLMQEIFSDALAEVADLEVCGSVEEAVAALEREPAIDGYADDWPDPGEWLSFEADSGQTALLMAGEHRDRLYLMFEFDRGDGRDTRRGELSLRAPRPAVLTTSSNSSRNAATSAICWYRTCPLCCANCP